MYFVKWFLNIFFRVSLMLNGEEVTSIAGTNNTSSTNSIILPLNRGDRVHTDLMRGKLIEISNGSRFERYIIRIGI